MKQPAILARMVALSQASEARPNPDPESIRASLREPGLSLAEAIDALQDRPDESTRGGLRRSCLDHGAVAVAGARCVIESSEIVAQIYPAEERLGELIAEQGTVSDWPSAEQPIVAWHELFRANQCQMIDRSGPSGELFDRLIVAVGRAAELCAWLDERSAGTQGLSLHESDPRSATSSQQR